METALHEFNRTKDKMVDDFKTIVKDAEALLQATSHVSGEGFSAEREKFAEKLRHAKTRLADAEQQIIEKAKQGVTATDQYVHNNPWTSVGIASAVGMLIGFLSARR